MHADPFIEKKPKAKTKERKYILGTRLVLFPKMSKSVPARFPRGESISFVFFLLFERILSFLVFLVLPNLMLNPDHNKLLSFCPSSIQDPLG